MPHYEGTIWRPPSEARSLILQATVGCSHNACIFCVSYRDREFRVRGAEGIASDLRSLDGRLLARVRRVFLADGNALAMSTTEMEECLDVLREHLPSLERVGVYAYAKDLRDKTVGGLRRLRGRGLGIVYLGLETGDEDLLRWCRKGVTVRETIEACKKIRQAGIPLSLTIILGLGGRERSRAHATATARALNEIDPEYVGALTLMTPPGVPIYDMVRDGRFRAMGPLEVLGELRTLVEGLDLTDCTFRTNHASNYLPLGGTLGRDKSLLLDAIDRVLMTGDTTMLRPEGLRGL